MALQGCLLNPTLYLLGEECQVSALLCIFIELLDRVLPTSSVAVCRRFGFGCISSRGVMSAAGPATGSRVIVNNIYINFVLSSEGLALGLRSDDTQEWGRIVITDCSVQSVQCSSEIL